MVFKFFRRNAEEEAPEYIEIDEGKIEKDSKVMVRTFSLRSYEDINNILNSLREGYTITIIDIKDLKARDVVELKRAVSKIKKTIEAIEGSIIGFGGNILIAAPSFVKIQKGNVETEEKSKLSKGADDLESF